ncbi:MAG TPA: CHC2 zinc finger domain-containing protein [Acidimicrobiales bacterium]|nr:CHC2 zinc finger domain-containing protein [Acidimicrobiales bacterium]
MYEVLELFEIDAPARIPGHILCLRHEEDTPSLCIYEDGFYAYCCGQGGSVIDFVMFVKGCSFREAMVLLEQDWDGERIDRPARREPEPVDLTAQFESEARWGNGLDVRAYVRRTWPHLSWDQLFNWGVRAGRNSLLIPHYDSLGRIVGVKVRSLSTGQKRAFPGSTFPHLYLVYNPPEGNSAWLVEGESDTWTMTMAHPDSDVYGLPSGANTWRPAYRDQLFKYQTVWVALDSDDAGHKASDRIVADLRKHARHDTEIHAIWPVGAKDWTELAVMGVLL